MKKMIQKIVLLFELRSFGVSEWWGRKLGIKTSKIRLFFIYSSFIALGSPIIVYLMMGFILEHKYLLTFRRKRTSSIWEL